MDVIKKLSHVAKVAYVEVEKMAPHVYDILNNVITHFSPPPNLGDPELFTYLGQGVSNSSTQ